jgi:hypothetical protein
MNRPEVLRQLLVDGQASLASWFAVPLTAKQAQAGLSEIRRALLNRRATQQVVFSTRLAELIFRFWAGSAIEVNYRNLLALLNNERELALLDLCYGQLLMSRKQEPAWQHLDKGFTAAAHLFAPEDYFTVLRRHELLRQLPLSLLPSAAATLEALQDEARVIARLRGTGGRPAWWALTHHDTLD